MNPAPPEIKLPWPPAVTAEDFVRSRPKTKIDIKSPNSFFVYRTAFVKQLLIEQHKFKMTQVSKWASSSWKKESKEVKETYKVMAQKIDKEFSEKRKAIKGYRIVCENFDLITAWQPPNYSEYIPYMNMTCAASPGSTSSDTYESDNTINNSPISPRSPDFSFFESNYNSNTHVYLPTNTFADNFCATLFNDQENSDENNSSPTIIDESYYNPAVCIVSETPNCFIEEHYNDYLSWH
ncbi:3323_t:CDS:2 [Funneliformis geosporum]|uniref:20048_t:CDS:1 n=1 Tax=Funneliformis geosporum TaxID=1117311 RepID=A0A9W4SAY3_9GLOM|nr:20048_t:CDS:2 [Funneliformis geosporum]CAI2162021.1 3323_t:CDS:2 [Funneliformis geosporum]